MRELLRQALNEWLAKGSPSDIAGYPCCILYPPVGILPIVPLIHVRTCEPNQGKPFQIDPTGYTEISHLFCLSGLFPDRITYLCRLPEGVEDNGFSLLLKAPQGVSAEWLSSQLLSLERNMERLTFRTIRSKLEAVVRGLLLHPH